MSGPYFLGTYGKQPAIVDAYGVPVPRAVAQLILRAIIESHWDMTDGQREMVIEEKRRNRRPRRL